ncbi:hypothetical protein NDU88_003138, partial [Pleurodeles waltl]
YTENHVTQHFPEPSAVYFRATLLFTGYLRVSPSIRETRTRNEPVPLPLGDTNLRNPSTFMPPSSLVPVEVLTFEKAVRQEIESMNSTLHFQNVSNKEREAIRTLSHHPEITM